MQKMNKPFVTFPHINKKKKKKKKEEEGKKKKTKARFEPAQSRLVFHTKNPSLVRLHNHWDTTDFALMLVNNIYIAYIDT